MISEVCLAAVVAISASSDEGWTPRAAMNRIAVCEEVAERAEHHHVDPTLAVAVAWHESSWRHGVRSRVGAHGPMQVMPLHCGGRECDDPLDTGVRVLRRYLDRERDASYRVSTRAAARALARYACGNRCDETSEHALSRIRTWWKIRQVLRWRECAESY